MERPIKQLSPQEWETLIEDFQSAADRCLAQFPGLSLLDLALHSLLRKDTPLPLKSSLILFLDENSLRLIPDPASSSAPALAGVLDALRSLVQSPVDAASLTLSLKEQMMVSSTSFMISLDALDRSPRHLQGLVELLLAVANRPNHSVDRHTRSVACECLRELENAYPCLLAEITPHLWNLCQSERTHASQSYILLLTAAIHNLILRSSAAAPNISLLSTSAPLVPFNIPHSLIAGAAQNLNSSSGREISNLNSKELRKVMAFLLERPQILTPCGMMEFMWMLLGIAAALELQVSLLKMRWMVKRARSLGASRSCPRKSSSLWPSACSPSTGYWVSKPSRYSHWSQWHQNFTPTYSIPSP